MNAEQIMSQAQVFASAWALVGGRFDNGDMLETANEEKAELQTAIEALVQERDAAQQLAPALTAANKVIDKLAAENKTLRDAWSAEPVGYISEHEKDSAMDKFRYLPSKMYPTPVYTRSKS